MATIVACSHLAADGQYRAYCQELVNKYPNLLHKDFKHARLLPLLIGGHRSAFRFTTIVFEANGLERRHVVDSLPEVQQQLQEVLQTAGSRRLHILEGQSPELFALLGRELETDPQVFMRHQRTALYDCEHEGGNTPCLASLVSPNRNYVLDFYEPRYFPDGLPTSCLECADSLRHIALPRKDGRFENVAVICNKVSFCGRSDGNGGWTALMIVDPPANTFFRPSVSGSVRVTMRNVPYQGGYPDFIPYSSLAEMRAQSASPRTSIFDDMCHYFQFHSERLEINQDPASSDLFLRKIVASHFMILSEYCAGVFSHLEWRTSRQERLETLTVPWLQQRWNDIQVFHRRVEDYCQVVRAIRRGLQLNKAMSSASAQAWTSSSADFEDIQERFDDLLRKSESLIASFSGLSGIISSRESLTEAETVGRLTILGMIFLPLSFVTGLFSMAEKYLPGAKDFGTYWAVSIPLVVVILLIPFSMKQARRLRWKRLAKIAKKEYRYWDTMSQAVSNPQTGQLSP